MKDSIENKLKKIRKRYSGSSNKEFLKKWRKDFQKLVRKEKYLKLEPTQKLVKKCQEEIKGINKLLISKEDIDTEERKALFKQRKVWEKILSMYNPKKVEKQKESMENWLDNKIT